MSYHNGPANAPSSAAEMKRQVAKTNQRDSVGTRKGKTKGPVPGKLKRYDGRAVNNARFDKQLRSFYEEIDLPEFKSALELADDPRMKMFFYALSSPKMHEHTFAELCKRCKLTLKEISELWRNHQLHRGMIRMMNQMPKVMEDAAIEAQSRTILCVSCDGTGKTVDEGVNRQKSSVCPECHGDGKIRIPGDKDARSLVFESVGLRKGAGQNVNLVQVNALPAFEDATRLIGSLDIASGESVEAETPKNDIETQEISALPPALAGGGDSEGENAEFRAVEERFEGSGGAVEAPEPDLGVISRLGGDPDPLSALPKRN